MMDKVKKSIGFSEQGSPIDVYIFGEDSKNCLKLVFLAGQHGDEELAYQALCEYMENLNYLDAGICLAIIPMINPDGLEMKSRLNSEGIDLNRDHLILQSCENRALHQFLLEFQPHIFVDLHNYPPRRKHLKLRNIAYCHDVFFDIPTNPNMSTYSSELAQKMLHFLVYQVRTEEYLVDRYTIVRQGSRVRHGTPDIVDARNFLSLRFNMLTLLIEGYDVRRKGTKKYRRVVDAINLSLKKLVIWARENKDAIRKIKSVRSNNEVVTVSSYKREQYRRRMLFRDLKKRRVRRVTLDEKYTPSQRTRESIIPPKYYLIPSDMSSVLDILRNHGYTPYIPTKKLSLECIEEYEVISFLETESSNRSHRKIVLNVGRPKSSLEEIEENYTFFRVDESAHMLCIALEPSSKYALHRYKISGLSLNVGERYPILRGVE